MMVDVITRAEWGARPPTRPLTQVPWSQRVGVAVHYTFGDKHDTPLDLQRYAQDTLGYADGHYNLLVDYLGRAYEGRGWTVSAAHSEGENVEWVGVAFIGKDADVTPEAEATIAALCTDADRLAGRSLKRAGHQELPGAQTSCPGPRLMGLVLRLRSGEDDDMFEQPDRNVITADTWRTYTLLSNGEAAEYHLQGEAKPRREVNGLRAQLDRLEEKVAALSSPALSDEQLVKLADLIAARIPAPATPEQIAEAVLDEDHARSAQ